jgi:DNA transposition AAA+ family ATPase
LAIFVDEADYVVGNARIMETLRDIYDATEQPLILVGMEEIARRISQRKQLFNRISQWIEFKPADLEDVSLIASEMLEVDVEIDDALLDLIRKRSNGVVRTIVSALDKIEKMAMASDARIIRLEDVDASELLHDVRRSR